MPYANNKGADQPAHPRSLISAFVVRCICSIISILAKSRRFKTLANFCGCAGRFESYLVKNPEDKFSRDKTRLVQVSAFCILKKDPLVSEGVIAVVLGRRL